MKPDRIIGRAFAKHMRDMYETNIIRIHNVRYSTIRSIIPTKPTHSLEYFSNELQQTDFRRVSWNLI